MSKKKDEKKVTEKVLAGVDFAAPQEPIFVLYELREHCHELFGVSPEIYDGALFDCKDKQITKLEAQKRITNYLTRKLGQEVRS